MPVAGKKNSLTDVKGLEVGQYGDEKAMSGVTVVLCTNGAVAGVDVRGSAPGTRETDVLDPVNLVDRVQAVVLSGGSVYGLAAADGVVQWLAERGAGYPLDDSHVAPIVPAAVLFDLGRGESFTPPISPEWGKRACDGASDDAVAMGNRGAGTGAVAGGIKGGVGTSSILLDSGITIGALVAVNAFGSVVDPVTGRIWERDLELNGDFGRQGRRAVQLPDPPDAGPARNTTIGVVATDGILSKVQAQKIAQMAHDGMARAVRPSHTMFDGDSIFCLSTCEKEVPEKEGFFPNPEAQKVNEIGHAAADCMARAIIRGVISARSLGGFPAFEDLDDM